MADSVTRRQAHEQRLAWISLLQLIVGKGTVVLVALIVGGTFVMTARQLGGKQTKADIAFRMFADFRGFRVTGIAGLGALAAGGISFGAIQLSQRKKERARYGQQASLAQPGASNSQAQGQSQLKKAPQSSRSGKGRRQ